MEIFGKTYGCSAFWPFLIFLLITPSGFIYATHKNSDCPKKCFIQKKNQEPRLEYHFSTLYEFQRKTVKDTMHLDYYLGKDFFAISIHKDDLEIFQLYDEEKEKIYNFSKQGKNRVFSVAPHKKKHAYKLRNNKYLEDSYITIDLPNKKIAHIDSKGKRLENNRWIFTIYFSELPRNPNPNFRYSHALLEEDIQAVLQKNLTEIDDNLLLYYEIKDKFGKEGNVVMEATQVSKTTKNFSTEGYKPL